MNERTCRACGTGVAPAATFCPRCGAALGTAPPSAASPVAPSATSWRAPAMIAPPGLRVVSWLIDSVVTVVIALALMFLVGLMAAGASTGGGALGLLLLMVWLPQLAVLAWGVVTWVWEARTGKRVGNLVIGLRTVDAVTGSPPGLGKVFVSRLVIGVITFALYFIGGLITSGNAEGSAPTTVVSVLVLVAAALVAGTGALDQGVLKQGWHEKASGTTMVRAAAALAPAARTPSANASASPTATAVGSVAVLPTPAPSTPAPMVAPMPTVGAAPAPTISSAISPAPVTPAVAPVPAVAATHAAASSPAPLALGSDGLIAQVPGFAQADPAPTPAPAPAPVQIDDEDEIEHTRISRGGVAAAGRPRLSFDTGEVLVVEGLGLVGRAPEPAPGESPRHVVPITDPDRSISKTHLAFGRDGDSVWVEDKGSTNGTDVLIPGSAPIRVLAGNRVVVPDGASVRFGERSFTLGRA